MNYFELHIGDLTEATAHLSILEDGAYGRLMRKYYATEKPLPADLKQVQRLIGARSKEEREAVQAVLEEYFELQDDGWHQSRCDAEIAAFHEKQVGKEGKREGAKERQRRARERRAHLFDALRGHGIVPAWTTTSAELEMLLSRVTTPAASQPVTQPVTRDDTATQTPDTNLQTPEIQGAPRSANTSRALDSPDPPTPGTRYGLAAMAMRQKGMGSAHPGDPRLRALVDAEVSLEEFEAAAAEAVEKGKGFPWALTALTNRRAELAANPIAAAPAVDWRETQEGVSERAIALGIQAWPDYQAEAIRRGVAPRFDTWKRQVIDTDRATNSQEHAA